ncbi:MAG: hypothetical protein CMB56_002850 [Methanobacteriota archaeon]|nr:MAG: hypothetical protein CMB56_002850 [Euryarchaeota archaeon]|tara:strand:- start:1846 stop:3975 length:2130 start_codon:yes stop_codon:yes gene_type:complete
MSRFSINKNIFLFLSVTILLFSPIASSRTVFAVYNIDVLPQGEFNSSDEWEIDSQFGFTDLESENTNLLVGGGKVTIEHERQQNLRSMNFWANESKSGHESAIGYPDSELSISSGADIDLSGFDFSSVSNYPLVSNSLLLSFRISDGLNDDRVEISISFSDSAYLIKSYSNTFSEGEVNYLVNPYLLINIDEYDDWTWDSLSDLSVKLNYESVGGSDEAQLEVDAVGIMATYQMSESGFDFVKAQTQMTLSDNYEYGNLSLYLSGSIFGDFGNLDTDLSWLKLQIGTDIIYEMNIDEDLSDFEININLNRDLFLMSQELIFALGVQIFWDSDGSYKKGSMIINEVNIEGITITEWDESPQCLEIEDYVGEKSFTEDSGEYAIISLIDYCSDDRTDVSNLNFSVDVINESIINVEIEEGYLKIFQIPQSSGITEIVLNVTDESGNQLRDTFLVEVKEVNDPPMISNFPDEVWIELNEQLILEGEIMDYESNLDELEISVDNLLVKINNSKLIINARELGTFDVILTVSDGSLESTHKLTVHVFSEPDIIPVYLNILDSEGEQLILDNILTKTVDSNVRVISEIKNLGKLDATFISIRYYSNEELIHNHTIPVISSNSSVIVEFDWDITKIISNYSVLVVVDYNNLIDESNELNNELFLNFSVESNEKGNLNAKTQSLLDNFSIIYSLIFLGFLILCLILLMGPKKIKKIS